MRSKNGCTVQKTPCGDDSRGHANKFRPVVNGCSRERWHVVGRRQEEDESQEALFLAKQKGMGKGSFARGTHQAVQDAGVAIAIRPEFPAVTRGQGNSVRHPGMVQRTRLRNAFCGSCGLTRRCSAGGCPGALKSKPPSSCPPPRPAPMSAAGPRIASPVSGGGSTSSRGVGSRSGGELS